MPAGGSTGAHTLPVLDGLRGVAALMVLATHVAFQTGEVVRGVPGALLGRLDFGVALFFVLSGFLLTRPWLAHGLAGAAEPSTRRYLLRRTARILPAYWAALLAVLLTSARGTPPSAAVSNALLLQTYTDDLLRGFTQTWSLCTEVAFYLVLPLAAPAVAGVAVRSPARAAWLLLGTLPVAWAWAAWAAGDSALPAWAGVWLPGHLDWFAAGMAIALLEQVRRTEPAGVAARTTAALATHPGTLVALAAAVFWLSAGPLGGPQSLSPASPFAAAAKEALYCAAAAALLAACAFADQRRGVVAALLAGRAGRVLGRYSYGVFLWHLLVLTGVYAASGLALFSGWFWPVLVATAAGSLMVAALSWHLLEAPVLRWAHREPATTGLTRRQPAPAERP